MSSTPVIVASTALMAATISSSSRRRRLARLRALKRIKNNGENKSMSNELIKEFIGKDVVIVEADGTDHRGRLVACEDNWLKLEEKRITKLINADMVNSISYKHLNL